MAVMPDAPSRPPTLTPRLAACEPLSWPEPVAFADEVDLRLSAADVLSASLVSDFLFCRTRTTTPRSHQCKSADASTRCDRRGQENNAPATTIAMMRTTRTARPTHSHVRLFLGCVLSAAGFVPPGWPPASRVEGSDLPSAQARRDFLGSLLLLR